MALLVRKVLVLVAMEQEARPFIERHALVPTPGWVDDRLPFKAFKGFVTLRKASKGKAGAGAADKDGGLEKGSRGGLRGSEGLGDLEVILVWAGKDERFKVNNVATSAAVLSAFTAIKAFKPDLVVSSGTAGGFQAVGGRIGDVYLSTKCVFHSRRIPSLRANSTASVNEEYGVGHFRSPPLNGLAGAAGLKQGVVSTSDRCA